LQQDPSVMGFDTWGGSQYDVPPMPMDQFPDYDWAAAFEFSSSEFPNVPVGPINPMMPGPGPGNAPNMQYTYG
jgi:transcriptional regulatory protein LEU3